MKKKLKICICWALMLSLLIPFAGCSQVGKRQYVQLYETTGTRSKLLQRQTDLKTEKASVSGNVQVDIDVEQKFQEFVGVGATMTHASAWLLYNMDEESRSAVLQELFGKEGGCFSIIRLPIGSSDYTYTDEFFTLDDMPDGQEDPELAHFNLDHDVYTIYILKCIQEINPDITYFAVPWSAPAWMKTGPSLLSGSLDEAHEEDFARYLCKFVEAYAAEGIEIDKLCIVNEPFVQNLMYPNMNMDGAQAARVAAHLGPMLKDKKLDCSIMAYDHNYSSSASIETELYLDAFFANEEAAKYTDAVAYHGYGNDGFYDFYPGLEYVTESFDREIYITEITEHSGSIDFAANLSYALQNTLINPFNYNVNGACFWNYCLTSDGQPVKGNSSICFGLMSVDQEEDGSYHYSKYAAYYALAHFGQFLYPVNGENPVRVFSESSNPDKIIVTAFLRADDRLVVVAHNTDDVTSEVVDFCVDGNSVTYELEPQSVVTLIF